MQTIVKGNTIRTFQKHQTTKLYAKQKFRRFVRLCGVGEYSTKPKLVLGIETSCDDTGAAVVTEDGEVLGEGMYSQKKIHVKNGGIIPILAQSLHRQFIDNVVQEALSSAGVSLNDISALATTIMPGLALSLGVGLEYSKDLLKRVSLPFIPVHHMEAHALTIRMIERVDFPFLVLLVSGGHCILAVARGVGDFLILGQTYDDAPGEAFDKVARSLRLHHHPDCVGLGGGQAIEKMAEGGDFTLFHHKNMFKMKRKDSNFSFSSLKQQVFHYIRQKEFEEGVGSATTQFHLQNLQDIAASFQHKLTQHLCTRILRGMEYCRQTGLLPQESQNLVVSGGVASNSFIRNALSMICDSQKYKLLCPPPKLCTDNGIMIAWAGMEHLKQGTGFAEDPQAVRYEPRYPLGKDISGDVGDARIDVRTVKFWR